MKLLAKEIFEKKHLFVDVRSSGEYIESHIPNAINIPLLDNNDRHEIGKIYKQLGKDFAIKEGLKRINPSLQTTISKIISLIEENDIVLYCQRGGMRSSSLYNLLISLGYKNINILEGGYKSYRNFVLDSLEKCVNKLEFIVLQGYTGVGKTLILDELKKQGASVLNLEELANHCGSVFGSIPNKSLQPSQKQFQNDLYENLRTLSSPVFIEAESTKIGALYVPATLKKKIDSSKQIIISAETKFRVEHLYNMYVDVLDERIDSIFSALKKIKRFISKQVYHSIDSFLKNKEYKEAIRLINENYYDPIYERTIKRKSICVYAKIKHENTPETALQILKLVENEKFLY